MKASIKNEGSLDQALRILIGLILFLLAYYILGDVLQIIAFILSAILVITGLSGYCLIYSLLGIDTLPKKNK